MKPFTISPRAQSDLDGIWEYIGLNRDRPAAATRQIERLFETFMLLAAHPLLGEKRDDLLPGLRAFTAGRYVVLYRVVTDRVDVAAVIHSSRDIWSAFFGETSE